MESIHILEPAFHICAAQASFDRCGRRDVSRAAGTLARAKNNAGGPLGAFALRLLDRLAIFSAPRIISAECLFTDTSTMGSASVCRRNEKANFCDGGWTDRPAL